MTDAILKKFLKSKFRSKFKLSKKDKDYINLKGFDVIESHAQEFIKLRIAPEVIENDGKQIPFKNHPVFVAQHATATCCRGCIFKWHKFPKNMQLSIEQQQYLVSIIMAWISRQCEA